MRGSFNLYYLALLSLSIAKNFGKEILWNLHVQSMVPTDDRLADCLQSIVKSQSSHFTQTIQLRVQAESSSVRQEFFDTIQVFRSRNRHSAFELDFDENVNYEVHLRIYFIDSLSALKVLMERQTQQGANNLTRDQFYLIVLPKKVSLQDSVLKRLFDLCFGLSIININALIEDDTGTVTLYTYYPFNEKACHDTSPAALNRFVDRKFKWDESVFPDKINNFWQCPLKVILQPDPPVLIVDDGVVSGPDGRILNSLSHFMNFSMQFTISTDRGAVIGDDSVIGGFKLLNESESDVLIGACLCRTPISLLFSERTYDTLEIVIHLKPHSAYSPLDVLIMPFDIYTWIILLIVLIARWILGHKGLGILKSKSKRLFLAPFLLSAVILRSSYEGSVFKFLHNRPVKALPTDLDGALSQGYKFLISPNSFTFYSEIPNLNGSLIVSKYSNKFDEFFDLDGKYGVFAQEGVISYFSQGREYYTLQNPLLNTLFCMVFKKFSFLPQKFERKFEQIFEHKLIQNPQRKSKTKKREIVKNQTIFSIKHLMGAFQLYIALNTTCLIVFVVELLARRNRFVKIALELFY